MSRLRRGAKEFDGPEAKPPGISATARQFCGVLEVPVSTYGRRMDGMLQANGFPRVDSCIREVVRLTFVEKIPDSQLWARFCRIATERGLKEVGG